MHRSTGSATGGTPQNLTPTVRFVESWTHPGEDILLIADPSDHLVADRAGVVNVSPLNGITSLLSPAEADRALDQLEDAGGSVVIERTSCPAAGRLLRSEYLSLRRSCGSAATSSSRRVVTFVRIWRRQAR